MPFLSSPDNSAATEATNRNHNLINDIKQITSTIIPLMVNYHLVLRLSTVNLRIFITRFTISIYLRSMLVLLKPSSEGQPAVSHRYWRTNRRSATADYGTCHQSASYCADSSWWRMESCNLYSMRCWNNTCVWLLELHLILRSRLGDQHQLNSDHLWPLCQKPISGPPRAELPTQPGGNDMNKYQSVQMIIKELIHR